MFHRCKERLVVNGMSGKIKYVEGNTIFTQTANVMVPVFPAFRDGQQYYPIVAGYARNIGACNISL